MTIANTIALMQNNLSALKDQLKDFQARIAEEGSVHHQEFVQHQMSKENRELRMLNDSQKSMLQSSWDENAEVKAKVKNQAGIIKMLESMMVGLQTEGFEQRRRIHNLTHNVQIPPQGEDQYGDSPTERTPDGNDSR